MEKETSELVSWFITFLFFHGIQLFGRWVRNFICENGEKDANTLPNQSSLFPSSHKFRRV